MRIEAHTSKKAAPGATSRGGWGAKLANILGPPYPRTEAILRLFGKCIEAEPQLAKAARDKLYAKNPNYTAQEALDFLKDFLGEDAPRLLPATAQPKTVVDHERKMEKQIAKIVAGFSSHDRMIFLMSLHAHVEGEMNVAWGLIAEDDPYHEIETAEIMACSDDPAMIEEARQTLERIRKENPGTLSSASTARI